MSRRGDAAGWCCRHGWKRPVCDGWRRRRSKLLMSLAWWVAMRHCLAAAVVVGLMVWWEVNHPARSILQRTRRLADRALGSIRAACRAARSSQRPSGQSAPSQKPAASGQTLTPAASDQSRTAMLVEYLVARRRDRHRIPGRSVQQANRCQLADAAPSRGLVWSAGATRGLICVPPRAATVYCELGARRKF